MTNGREYVRTHPWITFRLDSSQIPAQTWILLGEARSKCEHLAGVPLRPGTARELNQIYLAKGALATTAIEGNTLSEEQALQRVRGELKLPPSKEYLGREIDNIVAACGAVWTTIESQDSLEITPDQIKQWNRDALRDLSLDDEVVAGEFRTHSVGVASYRGAPWQDCDYLIGRLCEWIGEFRSDETEGVVAPILGAILAHLYLTWIHPFGDGNGRTARLVEYAILVSAGMPMPAAHVLSNHYNATRSEYYRQLDRASKSGGDVVPFVRYAAQGLVDGLRDQVARVRHQQVDVAWRNYVHESFRKRHSDPDKRRRDLVLDLSRTAPDAPSEWIDLDDAMTGTIGRAYRTLSERTLQRDLNELKSMELIDLELGRVRIRREVVTAFLPARRRRLDR